MTRLRSAVRGTALALAWTIPLLATTLPSSAQTSDIECRYRWEYAGRMWTLTHRFCDTTYRFYRSLPRTLDYRGYGIYTSDPRQENDLRELVQALETLAAGAGLNVWEKLNLVISFAQSIPYVAEEGEYPRYPIETLVDMRADCEDASILTAALLHKMGFGVVLLAFLDEHHMAVGVRVLPPNGAGRTYYTWNGDAYYYLEPTSVGWEIGEIPDGYASWPEIVDPQPTFASKY